MSTSTREADVIVLGAGIAGLAAAVAAAEAGAETFVLERQDGPGGSTAMSGGLFAFTGTVEQDRLGIEDRPETLMSDLRDISGHRADDDLLRAYVLAQEETYRWLRGKGTAFSGVKLGAGQSVPRSHQTSATAVLDLLHRDLVATGRGALLSGHRALALERSGSRVGTVRVETTAGTQTFRARRGVVIATGGFSRSRELLERFAPAQADALPYGGPGNTGDGLLMAWQLGAGFRDMGYVAGTFGSHPDTGEDRHELLCAFYLGAIIVNTEGRRFVDESLSYKVLGDACLRQPGQLGFQVFDARVRALSQPGVPLMDMEFLEEKGHLLQADTLDQLAAAMAVDPETLSRTMERYNASVRAGGPDEFARDGLCNHVGELVELVEPPFYAYPSKTLMTSTYCGLTITPRAEVLDVFGRVIEGLYAAGEVTGGFHGQPPMTGASLGMSALFGLSAGRHAALAEPVDRDPAGS